MRMTIKLNAPGMTSLHKAGLAGLYRTLLVFEETGQRIEGLEWKLEPTQITLDWLAAKPAAAFERLIKLSFKLDKNGLIELAGLEVNGQQTLDQKYHVYTSLL